MNYVNKSQEVIKNALDQFNEEKEKLELLLDCSKKPIHTMIEFDGSYNKEFPHDDEEQPCCSYGETREFRNTANLFPIRVHINPAVDKDLIIPLFQHVFQVINTSYLLKSDSTTDKAQNLDSGCSSIDDDLPF